MNDIKTLIIDIETGIVSDYELFKPDFKEPRKTVKGEPDKRDKSIAEQEHEWKSKLALSPLTGQVLMIGYNWNDDNGTLIMQSKDEKQLLHDFVSQLDFADLIIGHNIKEFDLPFIINRCRKHGLERPNVGYMKGSKWYWNDNVVDTMTLWGLGKYKEMISLNNLAKYFGLEQKDTDIDKRFQEVFNEDLDKATEYCKHDIELTKQIYERLK